MPSGSKKRKAAKKKKETELHAQTASIASPEESGNEHEDDVHGAQRHGQAGEEGEKNRAFGVESGSPICRTNALNQEAFAEEHTREITVDEDYPVESLEVSLDGLRGGRDESKQGVESYEGESDKNVSIQKVGSQEFSVSTQSMDAQRVSAQKTSNGVVELSPAQAEYESESTKSSSTTYEEGRSGADSLKLEPGLIPVGEVHTNDVECKEDHGGYAICDRVVRPGLDGEASTDFKDTWGSMEGPVTAHQELSSDAGSLKLDLPVLPASVVHAEPVEFQEEQGRQGFNSSLVHSRLGAEASSHCKDTQGFGKDSVTPHQELSGDADSLKLESAEFQQEQGGHDTNGRLVHSRLDGEASTHSKERHDLVKDSAMLHGELSCYSDSPKLNLARSPASVAPTGVVEVQQEQGGHAIDHSLVHSRFIDTEDVRDSAMPHRELNLAGSPVSVAPTGVVEVQQEQGGHTIDHSLVHSGFIDTRDVRDFAMPHRELSIHADSLKSEPDSTPVSVVHTDIVEFVQEQGGHGIINGSLVHSRLDGEASTHSEDKGDGGKGSVKLLRELSSDHQQQGGHDIDNSLVLSRSDGEASTSFEDTKGFVKDSVMPHQELSIVVDSPKKLESAALAFYAVNADAFEIPEEQRQNVDHSLVQPSLGDEAGNQFKYMEDFAKEVSIQASGEEVSDAHADGVLPCNRLSDISNKVEDMHVTSSVSLLPTERDSVVTEKGDSSLESKVNEPTVSTDEPVIPSSREVSRNDSDTSRAVGGDTQTSLNERDMEVTLHHQNTANQAVGVRRGFLASWKSCCGILEIFRGSRS